MIEAHDVSAADASADGILRLAWSLSRIAAVPTPDLPDRLANSLLEFCGPSGVATLQIGRVLSSGDWRCDASSAVARTPRDVPPARRVLSLPWDQLLLDDDGPVCIVRCPSHGEPELAALEDLYRAADASIQLAGIVRLGHPDGLLVAVQLGQARDEPGRISSSMLSLVLPWVHAIASHAVGEADGLEPRAWLTSREAEVLERLSEGRSVNQIAEDTGRSHYTVHDHVKSLHRKLGVSSRAALVRCGTRGVAPPSAVAESNLDRSRDLGRSPLVQVLWGVEARAEPSARERGVGGVDAVADA